MPKTITKKIKDQIEKLSNFVLENSGTYREYTPDDVVNATLIFSEVLMAKTYEKHLGKVNQEGMEKMAHELGVSLRQTILLFSGVDCHEAIKQLTKKK